MRYARHYVQFNDLVFSEYEMIQEGAYSTGFKEYSQEYGFGHGSYSPYKSLYGFAQSTSVSITLFLRMKKLPCDKRPFYERFVTTQLGTRGKLWAIKNNTLMWAYAYVSNKTEQPTTRDDYMEIDVDFTLPEGIWHKADKQKTFLVPFDLCEFMDCYGYKDVQPCFSEECCHCSDNTVKYCNCCECDDVTRDMALCYNTDKLQDFYNECGSGYKIVYDCIKAEKFFMPSFYGKYHIGEKYCVEQGGVIDGILYSDTDYPTDGITIMLHGQVKDPWIEINGNANMIKGTYEGMLTINSNGAVTSKENEDCEAELLPVETWIVPEGQDYGWTIYPGNNRIHIEPNNCCGTVCAYILVDAITI